MRLDFAPAIGAEYRSGRGAFPWKHVLGTMRFLIVPAAWGTLILLVIGLFGEWVALADSVGVFRPQIATLTGAFGAAFLVSRKTFAGVLFLFCAVAAQASTLANPTGHGKHSYPMALYQKNLLVIGSSPEAIAEDIRSHAPDFVTLQEISNRNLSQVKSLASSYPEHVICRSSKQRAVALFSDHPLIPGSAGCYPDLNLALAQVDIGEERIWVASVHLPWPFPYAQAAQASRVADVLSVLEGKVIVAGDFNMVPWGGSVARIARAIGGQRAGAAVTSFPAFQPLVPLAIDHVLLPSGAGAITEARPLLGSDHYGLLTRFKL
ncbi:MAG: endonuclease/exonuclease/phosphatase family protein [Hyphomicrobiaceae bacterium]